MIDLATVHSIPAGEASERTVLSPYTTADKIDTAACLLRDTELVAVELAREGGDDPDLAPDVQFVRDVLQDLRNLSDRARTASLPTRFERAALPVLLRRRGMLRRVYAVVREWLDESVLEDAGGAPSTLTSEYTALLDGLVCADDLLVATAMLTEYPNGHKWTLGRRGMSRKDAALWLLETSPWPAVIRSGDVVAYHGATGSTPSQHHAAMVGSYRALRHLEDHGCIERLPGFGFSLRTPAPAPADGMFCIGYLYGERFRSPRETGSATSPVASGLARRWGDAFERFLLQDHVGVKVDLGGFPRPTPSSPFSTRSDHHRLSRTGPTEDDPHQELSTCIGKTVNAG